VQTGNHPHKRNCNASKRYITATPISIKASIKRELIAMLHHRSDQMPRLLPHSRAENIHAKSMGAPPTYPFHRICNCQRTPGEPGPPQTLGSSREAPCRRRPLVCQRDYRIYDNFFETHSTY